MHPRVLLLLAAGIACAQPYQPSTEEFRAIRAKLADLSGRIDRLGARPDAALRADVEIYRKAGEWILRYPEEFYTNAYAANALKVLDRIDHARIVLRGFSMGGAGTWHIGLHHPSRWVAMEAGAGFTDTRVYAKLKEIPPYQASTLHIYDAMDYSLNAVNLPVVGYGG